MLIAPDAPAATAMHSTAVNASTGCRWPGAISRPTRPVNTTSVMTRGFSSAIQSRQLRRLRRRTGGGDAPPVTPVSSGCVAHPDQRMRGSSAKVWNGGGEDTVHSSVVAPSPQ